MGKGFKHGVSLDSPLDFSIKTYGSETALLESVPEENTIGLVPRYTARSWSMGEVLESPYVGDLWIRTGSSLKNAFNALKENALWVYPMSAWQYGAAVWVYVPAYSVKNGQWQFWWDGQLYCNGNEITPATGGWQSAAVSEKETLTAYAPTVKRYSYYMEMALSGYNRSGYVSTVNAVDLTDYDTAQVDISYRKASGSGSGITLAIVDTDENIVASQTITGTGICSVDISALTGMHYIRILLAASPFGSVTVRMEGAMLL